ncbi:hypothetical protein BDZ97DRAFT_193255 [Flammula alnicola]|nr:hypothetical protein BDZ97DRAFT_193255 [Flammula alnicola]
MNLKLACFCPYTTRHTPSTMLLLFLLCSRRVFFVTDRSSPFDREITRNTFVVYAHVTLRYCTQYIHRFEFPWNSLEADILSGPYCVIAKLRDAYSHPSFRGTTRTRKSGIEFLEHWYKASFLSIATDVPTIRQNI